MAPNLQALSTRERRDVLVLGVSVLVVTVAVAPVTQLLVDAWNAQGVGQSTARAVAGATIGLDGTIVLLAGVFVGWLALFVLDRSKRIQALLLAVASVFIVATLWLNDVWFAGTVAWLPNLPALLVGLVAGAATGAGDKVLAAVSPDREALGLVDREFPVAAAGLFLGTATVVGVGFVDLHVFGDTTALRTVADLVVATAFVGLLGVFIQYTDRRDVLLLSPERDAETAVICGLFDYVDSHYEARPTQGAADLRLTFEQFKNESDVEPLDGGVTLYYKRSGPFSRWISISTTGYADSYMYRGDLDRMASVVEEHGGVRDRLASAARQFRSLQGVLGDRGRRDFVDRINEFSVVLLVVPLSDESVAPVFDPDREDDPADAFGTVDYLTRYQRLCSTLSDAAPSTIVVATDGERAMDYFDETTGNTPYVDSYELLDVVADRLGLLTEDGHRLGCTVRLLSRERGVQSLLLGTRELLEEVDER